MAEEGRTEQSGDGSGLRECEICHRTQPVDNFGNPHAREICESCYRLIGVDIWAAGDEAESLEGP